jgi:iron complex transport system substrate-binding protein
MQLRRHLLAFFLAALAFGAAANAFAAERPHRIVSLNLCTDDLLWRLADRDQIASLSYLSADPTLSVIAGKIKGVPLNYGRAEEIRLMNPDLILAGTYGARFAVELLRSRGFKVVEIPPAGRLSDIAPDILKVGNAIGQGTRAKEMAATVRARIAKLAATKPKHAVTGVVFEARGYAAGAPSLANDVITLAGVRNLVAGMGAGGDVALGVEGLIDLSPEVVIIDKDAQAGPSIAQSILNHPALHEFRAHHRLIQVPGKLWGCATPATLDAVTRIRKAVESLTRSDGA